LGRSLDNPIRTSRPRRDALSAAALVSLVFTVSVASVASASRPAIDVSAGRRPAPEVTDRLSRLRADPTLSKFARAAHIDERYGVPTFVWATRTSGAARAAGSERSAE
jgi:hypothetical protein